MERTSFSEQARQVMVGVEGVIERCINEDKSCVIEGIHLVPQLLKNSVLPKLLKLLCMLVMNKSISID